MLLRSCGFVASSPSNIGETPFCLNVKAFPVSPMLPLEIIEMPVPSILGLVLSEALFTISKALEPLTELSARRITLPSALI